MKINPGRLTDPLKILYIEFEEVSGRQREVEKTLIEVIYSEVTEVFVKDYQNSMSNGTVNEVRMTMRYDNRVTNKMRVFRYINGVTYKIKEILPDETNFEYMHVYAERVDS